MPITAIANMALAFGRKTDDEPPISRKEGEKLHATIGQLVIEWDFLLGGSSLILGAGGKTR